MKSPSRLLEKLAASLFTDPRAQQEFVSSLLQPQKFSPALIWTQPRPTPYPFTPLEQTPWQPSFVDRVSVSDSPGRHPLHEAGAYYMMDYSSVFACAPMLSATFCQPYVIDVCSAPGGKAIFAGAALHPRKIICNEVIRKRTAPLIANVRRVKTENVEVFSKDPEDLAAQFPQKAEFVIVDAPCSGQSLLAKGKRADGCFHPLVIARNMKRQRRILAHAVSLLAPGGFLLYSTCTFSVDENESNAAWLLEQNADLQPRCVKTLSDYQSPYVSFPSYRLWPMSGLGAGSFTVLLQKAAAK